MNFQSSKLLQDQCLYFPGLNSFWTILNNHPVIDAVNGSNCRR